MTDPNRPPVVHALLVAWAVLGTLLLIIGLLYFGAAFLWASGWGWTTSGN
jgi:hypothetical protein